MDGNAAFANAGFGGFSNDAAGSTATGGTIGLGLAQSGSFSETVVLHPTDTAPGSALADQTVTVRGTVQPNGSDLQHRSY